MSSASRADLEVMDRDELVDLVLELDRRVDELEARVSEDFESAAKDRASIRATIGDVETGVKSDVSDVASREARERAKLARRLSTLEDEIGVSRTDALAIEEGGGDATHMTKLGRLLRHGPDAVSDQPGATLFRARELVENWNRWGTVVDDARGKERRLASKKHDLRTHLEDKEDGNLRWKQVYRAMRWVAENSGPNVTLKSGSQDEGKYVLVHRPDGESR